MHAKAAWLGCAQAVCRIDKALETFLILNTVYGIHTMQMTALRQSTGKKRRRRRRRRTLGSTP
jgi:hypothetical protein